MADLITLAELKTARGETGTDNDPRYSWLISVASQAIRNYSGRDFGSAQVTETRDFEYDGSGYMDIDDANTISAVEFIIPNSSNLVLDSTYQWVARPPKRDDSPVFWYLMLPGGPGGAAFSPEMGFKRNLDVYYQEHRFATLPQMVSVTGVWGWPTVPVDVKQAAIWTIEDWVSRDEGEGLTSEAIAGYARSWDSGGQNATAALAIPGRARDMLANYEKHMV